MSSSPSTLTTTTLTTATSRPGSSVPKLHQLLRRRLEELPGLTNAEVSRALDYPRPNVITMILQGNMKLPLSKVPSMARILEVDPVWLLRVTLREYEPEMLGILLAVLGRDPLMTKREQALIEQIRHLSHDTDPDLLVDAAFCGVLEKGCTDSVRASTPA